MCMCVGVRNVLCNRVSIPNSNPNLSPVCCDLLCAGREEGDSAEPRQTLQPVMCTTPCRRLHGYGYGYGEVRILVLGIVGRLGGLL